MKYSRALMAILLLSTTAMAKPLQIIAIPNASFVEVENLDTKDWLTVDELSLDLPVQAKVASTSAGDLVFSSAGTEYRIASSDVELSGESIVSGCSQVLDITQAKDSRSASTRGMGESCN